ncbi:MAG: 5-oxoprolinase subunit PxpB [Woeseiaceae bacterium]|nr:5-oxoprolinase subunit PxpB [Woeseiaceae bacterium]
MPHIESAGDDLLSVRLDDVFEIQRVATRLRDAGDWIEVVPGIDSVVVQFDALSLAAPQARDLLQRSIRDLPDEFALPDAVVDIEVSYGGDDGPDLAAVCEQLGMTEQEFIGMHTGTEQVVDLVGFTPGFVYIGGLGERLAVPRRDTPRQLVPAGSVAVADGRTGIYALPSPGGWSLIGRTTHALFDAGADEPMSLEAGMRVRFIAAGSQ